MKIPPKLTRFLLPVGIVAFSILIFFLLIKSKPSTQQKIIEEKIWFVESQTVQITRHQPVVQLIGKIISAEDIEISSSVEADVIKRWVSIGDNVSEGQKLISLDPTNLQLILAQREAEENEISALIKEEIKRLDTDIKLLEKEKSLLKIANNAVARAQTLEKSAMASSSQLDDAKRASLNQQIAITQRQAMIDNHPIRLLQLKAKLKSASARLAIAKDDLSHTDIISPVDGIITQIDLDQSEHVRKGTSLVRMYNHQRLELKAFVPEKHIPTIAATMAKKTSSKMLANKALNVTPNITLGGSIIAKQQNTPITLLRIGGEIEKNTAGSYLYFSLGMHSAQFIPGQTLALQLNMPTIENTIALPSDAIYGVDHVFSIKDARLKRVNITWLGETLSTNTNETQFLIQSEELHSGDTVLTSKFANAMDGLKVTTSEVTSSAVTPSDTKKTNPDSNKVK